ncbi:hypothetical protein NDU88_002120 [Pleurodeles waltl]|uniref:Uncharacterized protein n=1 Tax=Pleurodeles waltl TaxID=8319 RepID=A0AAV7VYH1_PLEWA|nr:hypothetical protein NDU88_002120 [Pleurodeles waltl]
MCVCNVSFTYKEGIRVEILRSKEVQSKMVTSTQFRGSYVGFGLFFYWINLIPVALRKATTGFISFVKHHGADDMPKGREVK